MQMFEDFIYSKEEVCSMLGITHFTLENWYRWEKKELKEGNAVGNYLPVPVQLENTKGRPLRWSLSMVNELSEYKKSIVKGRNGRYGKYTNYAWH